MFHVHDYEMMFRDSDQSLDYDLVCRCGDVAPDMSNAVSRELRSNVFDVVVKVAVGFVAGAVAVVFYAFT